MNKLIVRPSKAGGTRCCVRPVVNHVLQEAEQEPGQGQQQPLGSTAAATGRGTSAAMTASNNSMRQPPAAGAPVRRRQPASIVTADAAGIKRAGVAAVAPVPQRASCSAKEQTRPPVWVRPWRTSRWLHREGKAGQQQTIGAPPQFSCNGPALVARGCASLPAAPRRQPQYARCSRPGSPAHRRPKAPGQPPALGMPRPRARTKAHAISPPASGRTGEQGQLRHCRPSLGWRETSCHVPRAL